MSGAQKQSSNYTPGGARGTTLLCLLFISACFDPDPRSARGAIDAAAQAIEAQDGEALYRLIDERGRHALGGIIKARQQAKERIEADYPQAEQAAAIAALGDGAEAESAAQLFAARCLAPCMAEIGGLLAAPAREEETPEGVIIHTVRGTEIPMYVGKDTWYGIRWNTETLMAERDRASRELRQIEDNADLYRKQRALSRVDQGAKKP